MADLDAKLDEILEGDEPNPAPAPDAQPESTTAQDVRYAALDEVFPDDPNIPESYRNKTLADAIRVAEQHKYEAGVAAQRNQQWNQMQAERDAAKLALQFFQSQQQQPQAAQQPRETEEEYLQRLALRPQSVIGDEVDSRTRQHIDPLRAELTETREQIMMLRSEQARIAARDGLRIDPQLWEEISPQVGTFMAYNRWPADNPGAWAEAARRYLDNARAIAQRFQPAPIQAQPTIDVPRPGAPPNGTARSQSRPAQTGRRVPSRVSTELSSIAESMGLDPKRKELLEQFASENLGGVQ